MTSCTHARGGSVEGGWGWLVGWLHGYYMGCFILRDLLSFFAALTSAAKYCYCLCFVICVGKVECDFFGWLMFLRG
ncbi:hypothetical protein B0T22DRAFT_462366 [Podospora appendiculata]|uniref:Transmembrane protein n=1 Tax=Podospora appendiculata TaxID=314037 RepID=A0AAE0XCJ5_9PEZI|nr:hypothetical protein B0T22DRAFT_462366 [Podospora appendiculata]